MSGAILLPIGQALFHRSDASSALASATAEALGSLDQQGKPLTGDQLRARCNGALAAWENARTSASAFASSLLDKERAEAKEAGEKTMQAQAAAQEAEAGTKKTTVETCARDTKCDLQDTIELQEQEETKREALRCAATGGCTPQDAERILHVSPPSAPSAPAPEPKP